MGHPLVIPPVKVAYPPVICAVTNLDAESSPAPSVSLPGTSPFFEFFTVSESINGTTTRVEPWKGHLSASGRER